MSELPADQGVPPAGAANDNGDVRQAEVGGRRREPAPAQPVAARDRPMAAAVEGSMASPVEGPVPEAREGPMAASREGLGAGLPQMVVHLSRGAESDAGWKPDPVFHLSSVQLLSHV